ncbi:hypothetical protein jhhlp_004602 [Lomentospora prolificans]|uniref:Fork-head domain-containing protein n=1 Tax=Lomentospora prolificans TaxID=41688 RepID=A0A2N3NC19_9PEZI|nr:hypothetical protein jhhlp_004602 [Lomentospora prolificans]
MANPTRFIAPNEPLNIFQDAYFENPMQMAQNHMASVPTNTAPRQRRPLQAANSNVVLNPPNRPGQIRMSPHKMMPAASQAALAALTPAQGNKLQPMPMEPPNKVHHTTDSLQKKPFLSKFKTVAQKPSIHHFGKENVRPNIYPAPGPSIATFEAHVQKPNGKRVLMDAPNIKDSRPAKKAKTAEEIQQIPIPPHDSFPPIVDDGTKPGHSYATLIGMAILRSPNRRLTLSQIYKWISDNYSFYKPNDAGWQNSIRHNLSLHKAFYKIERPKDDPGKGNYWCIEPGQEHTFLKEKPTRRFTSTSTTAETVISARPETAPTRMQMLAQAPPSMPAQTYSQRQAPPPRPQQSQAEPTLPPTQHSTTAEPAHATLPPLPTSQATIAAPDLSSDATIPVSDAAAPEENDKSTEADAPLDSLYSPLPPTMHSSPPIPRRVDLSGGTTPPPLGRNPTSSVSRPNNRAFAYMDDSGYISSLESSVMRQKPSVLTSEADRPRIKRGRAEEEIARLRASSYDSPTKGRSWNGYAPPSSSPLRNETNQMLPPLTPAVKLKAPSRAPPSVSPNTNLRIHRDKVQSMLQSPLRKMNGLFDDNNLPWSPAFKLDDPLFGGFDTSLEGTDFNIFQDAGDDVFNDLVNFDHSSPIKRTAKKSRLDRSQSTSAITTMTSFELGISKTPDIPTLKVWEDATAHPLDTPSRAFEGFSSPSRHLLDSHSPLMQSPSKLPANLSIVPPEGDWNALAFDPADFIIESQDCAGVDILQGFAKIGSGSQNPAPRSNKPDSKPGISRFYSSGF